MSHIERRFDLPPGSVPHLPLQVPGLEAIQAGEIEIALTHLGSAFVELPNAEQSHTGEPYNIVGVGVGQERRGIIDPRLGRYRRTQDGDIKIVHDIPHPEDSRECTYPFAFSDQKSLDWAGNRGASIEFRQRQLPSFDMQEAMDGLETPILEIGGPTSDGYFFLDNVTLPEPPYITNIVLPRNPEYASYIDEVIDGRRLPFADGSVGAVIMSGLHKFIDPNELGVTLPNNPVERDILLARTHDEMLRFAAGKIGIDEVKASNRLPIYVETNRVLMDYGYLLVEGCDVEDVQVLRSLNFAMVAAREAITSGEVDGRQFVFPNLETAAFIRRPSS
ncbi:MAG TPA: hypothetical protein VJP80_07725 [Candidatus Saccharimonadales bacterium]|nr:hypothetical protein [Candidatus Saccharimonadales bacterium]